MWEIVSLKGKYFCEPKTWNYKLSMSVSKRVFESFGDSTVEPVRGTLRMASFNFALRDRKKTPRNLGWAKFGASWKPLKRLATLFGASLRLLEISWTYFRWSSSAFRCAGQVLYYFQEIMTPFWFQNWGESGSGEASKSQAVSDTDFNRFFADFETEMHAFKRKNCVFVECHMMCTSALRCTQKHGKLR